MKWKTEYFGFRLLVFVGFCGEVPVALLRKAGGCYDYRRRVVTELVRTGYLKERKFRGERRRVVRSLSLTSRGLNQIQHLSPGRAEQIRARLLAPADGQGDWRRTQRLHRNAACLLLAHQLGARWVPGRRRDDARRKELVYYSAYELNKVCGKDNKSARVSGVLLTPGERYYALYYLGRRNMRWNPETELLFRDQFEQSEAGAGFSYSGSILLGEAWEQAADLVPHALNPRSRLIRFAREDFFYYIAFDENGRRLLRAILDEHCLYRLQQYLLREAHCPVTNEPVYLFPLELLAGFYQLPGERQYHVRPGLGWFFDFQMPAIERLCNTGAELVSLPGSLLAGLDRKEGERNGS